LIINVLASNKSNNPVGVTDCPVSVTENLVGVTDCPVGVTDRPVGVTDCYFSDFQ
jgi:hypothetical protein